MRQIRPLFFVIGFFVTVAMGCNTSRRISPPQNGLRAGIEAEMRRGQPTRDIRRPRPAPQVRRGTDGQVTAQGERSTSNPTTGVQPPEATEIASDREETPSESNPDTAEQSPETGSVATEPCSSQVEIQANGEKPVITSLRPQRNADGQIATLIANQNNSEISYNFSEKLQVGSDIYLASSADLAHLMESQNQSQPLETDQDIYVFEVCSHTLEKTNLRTHLISQEILKAMKDASDGSGYLEGYEPRVESHFEIEFKSIAHRYSTHSNGTDDHQAVAEVFDGRQAYVTFSTLSWMGALEADSHPPIFHKMDVSVELYAEDDRNSIALDFLKSIDDLDDPTAGNVMAFGLDEWTGNFEVIFRALEIDTSFYFIFDIPVSETMTVTLEAGQMPEDLPQQIPSLPSLSHLQRFAVNRCVDCPHFQYRESAEADLEGTEPPEDGELLEGEEISI